MTQDRIVILDLGSTENIALARKIRELGVYSEIYPHDITVAELRSLANVKGIILSTGTNNIIAGKEIDAGEDIYESEFALLKVEQTALHDFDSFVPQLERFIFDTCQATPNWNIENFIDEQVELIRRRVGEQRVLLALSGGVDSSVVAALLIKAIGRQLVCIHVNNGLMRKGESEYVVQVFGKQLDTHLIYVDASVRNLEKLANITDPEQKRKIIGTQFIRVFEEEARRMGGIEEIAFLAQGTIYPDIIESGTKTTKAVKSHHNVGGLPEDMEFTLIEPIRQLFKDEVRECGLALGLPHEMVFRQPFPGPGLGVRCLGAITKERLEAVRESDAILQEEFARAGLNRKVWQYFTVVPDFTSVGVRNHTRTIGYPVIIRAVNTIDAMTATIEQIDWHVFMRITERILAEVPHVNRVCYDLTPKPVGTIEWE
ncbi:MAG: glutamine-hydrolyzing GMP synthase [Lachnospiraceae bacterium]|jgi:GMP synthase (glutamine-hydrolysing)|nr:glutamine-hydrolyzing GMP synthase [Lachnospiraceae bacterium]